jgi:hypothetical protein
MDRLRQNVQQGTWAVPEKSASTVVGATRFAESQPNDAVKVVKRIQPLRGFRSII